MPHLPTAHLRNPRCHHGRRSFWSALGAHSAQVRLWTSRLGLLAWVAACGSSTTLQTTGPEPVDEKASQGLRYYVAKDLLIVDVKTTYRRGRPWSAQTTADPACKPGDTQYQWISTEWAMGTRTVPDRRAAYRIGLKQTKTVQQTLNLNVSESGLLTSLNYARKDQSAEIVTNVAKGVAGIAGTVIGLPTHPLGPAAYFNQTETKDEGSQWKRRPDPPTDADCYQASDAGKKLAEAISQKTKEIADAQQARLELLHQARQPMSLAAIASLRKRDSLLARRQAMLETQLEGLKAQRAAAPTSFAKAKQVGTSDTVITFKAAVDVADLPEAWKGGDARAASALISEQSPLRVLLDSAHILIDILEPPETPTDGEAKQAVFRELGGTGEPFAALPRPIGCGVAADNCAMLYYREPKLRHVRVWVARDDQANAPFDQRDDRLVSLVSSRDKALSVGFAADRLGDGSVKLTLGSYGNIIGVEQSAAASLAGPASAFGGALASARQEFGAGLKAVQETQNTLQTIHQTAVAARLKDVQAQKDLIDAQVALQGATATRDLLAQKKAIDAEADLLKSQQVLAAAQETGTQTEALAAVRDEIDRLKVQIELLTQQLKLEQARRDLEKGQTAP